MKKFENLTEPREFEFYQVYEKDGVKKIHIFGYCYDGDEHWSLVEVSWFIETLAEFIENIRRYKDMDENYLDVVYPELAQYQDDMTAEEMVKTINNYFDGRPADYMLTFGELTEDTPCGNYVA